MKRFVAVALGAFCVLAPPARAADQQAPSPPAVTTPSPRALALSRRDVAALHIDESMRPMMQGMLRPMLDEQVKANPNLTEEQRRAIRETVEEFIADDMMGDIMQRTIPIYATTFSEDELQALAEFYESPRGQSIVAKMPLMGPAMGKVMVEIMPELRAKLVRKLCAKTNCGATPTKKATPS